MGTDIYLHWDKKSDKDDDAQITGFDITSGGVGYLRASIGMYQENMFLRQIFDEKYWDHEYAKCQICDGEGILNYDKKISWEENMKNGCKSCDSTGVKDGQKGVRFLFNESAMARFTTYIRLFLGHAITGVSIDSLDSEHVQRAKGMMETITKAIGGSMTNIQTSEVSDDDIFFKIEWINSVIQFFMLGYAKEKEGLEPRVDISW
jgi:hypothetical protein